MSMTSGRPLSELLVSPSTTLRAAIEQIDRTGKGIILVVDEERRLLGAITDGDVRRAVLAGVDLAAAASEMLRRKAGSIWARPVTAPVGTDRSGLVQVMRRHRIRHLPLVDPENRVVDLVTMDDLAPGEALPLAAVIMAGGYGTRLRPLTEHTPKPMLPVDGRPVMEWIVDRLRDAGVHRIVVTTHYLSDVIAGHFGDGASFGVQIEYVREDRGLGTAGALSLLPAWQDPLLVINGDVLTQVDFRAMLAFHQEHPTDMTVAVCECAVDVPYGLVNMAGERIVGIDEKPSVKFLVNAGIYLLEPIVQSYIRQGERLDMNELIGRLIGDRRAVAGFPIREYWIDIGQLDDYRRALSTFKSEPG